MMLPRRATAAIFDLDGVLVDSEPLYTIATQEIVGEYGKVFDWSVKGNMIGGDAREGARYMLRELGVPLDVEAYMQRRDARLRELFPTVEPMPGARDFVLRLRERAVPLAVATSSDREQFEIKTARHDWFSAFQVIVCGNDPEVRRVKPFPDIFLTAAARLGAVPRDCVVFEDAPAGVEAARAAGMQVIALPDPHMDRARFATADLVAGGYHELDALQLGP